MNRSITLRAALLLAMVSNGVNASDLPNGKAIYDGTCVACHSTGAAGAPKLGDAAAWAPRIKTGPAALYASATKGKGAMPPRGGNASLSDAEVHAAVNYLISQADSSAKSAKVVAPSPSTAAAKSNAVVSKTAAPVPAVAAAVGTPVPAPTAPTPAAVPASEPAAAPTVALAPGANANPFNRLMRPPTQRNLAPPEDGIHDPVNDGTQSLQPPLTAFAPLVKSSDGNRVDWVKSLNEDKIRPRYDRNDPNANPMVMDLNIVREVKGSMPDVVYPHKAHTQWLDCSNCHPAIFIPQKGANQISMAAILMGQKCGVCHGKVAFPISECRRCHSKNKSLPVKLDAKP